MRVFYAKNCDEEGYTGDGSKLVGHKSGVRKMPDLQSKWSRSGDKGSFTASRRLA